MTEEEKKSMLDFTKWVQWEGVSLGVDKKWHRKGTFTTGVFAKNDDELIEKYLNRPNKCLPIA